MNQKQIEQTRVIAEKDGWTFRNNGDTAELFTNGEFVMGCHGWKETPDFPIHKYLTDLNALHKVAMDVVEELSRIEMQIEKDYTNQPMFINGVLNEEALKARKLTRIENTINHIFLCFRSRPLNGQYIDLFNAVYKGIVYLQNQEK